MVMRNYTTLKEVFGVQSMLSYLVLAIFSVVVTLMLSYKFLQCIQHKNYVCSDYIKWAYKKNNAFKRKLIMLSLLSCFAFCLFNVVFAFVKNDYFTLIGFVFYIGFVILYVLGERKTENKVPLKFTNRMKRLVATYSVIAFIFFFGLLLLENLVFYYFSDFFKLLRFVNVPVFPCLMPLLVFLACLINKPFEKHTNKRYVEKTTEIFSNASFLKIAVTGSYGKTSVKNFLKDILSVKFKTVATPYSFNTPMGICRSAQLIEPDTEVFIAEMGARKKGDIKELCDIVKPDISVLNGVTAVHLMTFGNINNIIATKNEIMQAPSVKTGIFTCDNENTYSLYQKCEKEKLLAGFDKNADVYAENVKADKNGSVFDLVIGGQRITCRTAVLGRHNISNLTLACAVAHKAGMTVEEIAEGIEKVKSVEHRLNIIDNGAVTVIDDGYNSNVEGVKSALEVLGYFSGRKIVVTPGMTELGFEQNKYNYEFGVQLASVADYVFLVEGASCNAIRNGLVFGGGFDADKVKMVGSLAVAKEKLKRLVKEGDVVLFENDLTDRF